VCKPLRETHRSDEVSIVFKRAPSLSCLLPLALAACFFAQPASAIGFGVGVEAGGIVGTTKLTGGGITQPGLFGGGGALMLRFEFFTEEMFALHATLRGEGHGFGIVTPDAGGGGGGGGGELLLRAAIRLPIVDPFFEIGGGAAAAGGGGTLDTSAVGGALEEAVGGAMWAPAGYVGVGLNVALPLMPYFEVRLGTHIGGLLPLGADPPIPLTGIEQLSARAELWLGTGWQL
jgi:hypothetical protein